MLSTQSCEGVLDALLEDLVVELSVGQGAGDAGVGARDRHHPWRVTPAVSAFMDPRGSRVLQGCATAPTFVLAWMHDVCRVSGHRPRDIFRIQHALMVHRQLPKVAEVLNVQVGRHGADEYGLVVERIREGVWNTNRHDDDCGASRPCSPTGQSCHARR